MDLQLLLLALALMLVVEGLGPLLFPNKWRAYMQKLSNETPETVRSMGLTLVALGLILFYLFS